MRTNVVQNVSNATIRNWAKLNTDGIGRLTSRANKRNSQKRIIPMEYVSHSENIAFVQRILDLIDEQELNISSVILSLGISLLKRSRLYEKEHVLSVLEMYKEIPVYPELETINIPHNEFDILGLIYQSYIQEGKKNAIGSYYTPLKIVSNMTNAFRFTKNETFLDPCCGSGAFLLSVTAENPNQIYGVDNDETAVMIAKINLLMKYNTFEFIPQVYCLDYLLGYSFLQQCDVFEKFFTYIATNPPWGAIDNTSELVTPITSGETFSSFFVKSHGQLEKNGIIRFLLPESVLNVKVHKDIRQFILKVAKLKSITTYDDTFSGVTTKYVDITCCENADAEKFDVFAGDTRRSVYTSSIFETENFVFNFLSEEDVSIIQAVKKKGSYSLKHSVWALGIVTGDNKRKLSKEYQAGMEPIYTGKEIQPFLLKPANNYIFFNRDELQQVAKEEIYRSKEKLVYKFISNKLVFAYDSNSSLFLNSANILIPDIPYMSIKTVMAFLNSSLFQFMYLKLFGELKVLKGNLMELPFPEISENENIKLTEMVDSLLQNKETNIEMINEYIFSIYGLSEKQKNYVRNTVYGKVSK